MLLISFCLLLATALIGIVLAAVHLGAGRTVAIPWPAWGLHGLLGVVGFTGLLLGLRGPPRGEALGVGAFGRIAAVLLALALLAGLAILVNRVRRRRLPVLIVAVHATAAIAGVVILAAYALMG